MKLPFRLAKADAPPGPAEAGLLLADDAAALARVCAALSAVPTVHRVAGGFLLLAAGPTAWPAGVVRLRRLGGDLFVPADAHLLPRLLPDEMVGLTRDAGLVVLPTGALAFDLARPLRPAEWLQPARVRRAAWESLPSPPDRADRLTTVERPSPPGLALEILAEGRPDDADPLPGEGEPGAVPEDARPPSGSLLDRLRSGAGLRAGQFLAWVGKQFQMPGLGKLGGKLARSAVQRVPRLTEKVLGAQEAALREVLRQLQSGDVEKALKRAPVAVADPARPAVVGHGSALQWRDPRFSLASLLGDGGGPAAVWLGGGNVWDLLAAEYRRLAEDALRRGDARRAAYLYGVLLRDLRAAANALMGGGFFREAAVLYRDKLHDTLAAATAFDRAGEYDEAARLYERRQDYELAAEMFRRVGDEDRAVAFFEKAADRQKALGHWLTAGDLLRNKLGRRQAATACYRDGWRAGGTDAQTCGERCVDDLLVAEAWEEFHGLTDEAAKVYAPPRAKEAAAFFNYALHVGADFLPAGQHADLRDRTRALFARHLRAGGSGRSAIETTRGLFAARGGWTAPQLRDAEYAVRALARRVPTPAAVRRSSDGALTAVVPVRATGDLLLAIDDRIYLWKAATEDRTLVATVPGGHVHGLAASPDGGVVYSLTARNDGVEVQCFTRTTEQFRHRSAGYMPQGLWRQVCDDEDAWSLLPRVDLRDGEPVVMVSRGATRVEFRGYFLEAKMTEAGNAYLPSELSLYLFERLPNGDHWEWDEVFCRYVSGDQTTRWATNVTPRQPDASPLHRPPLDWLTGGPRNLYAVCHQADGVAVWLEFSTDDTGKARVFTAHTDCDRPVVAACLRGPDRVAVVTAANEVRWLGVAGARLIPHARPTPLAVPGRVVFLAPGATVGELLAVCTDGEVLRVPAP